jgi:hypothetical protein
MIVNSLTSAASPPKEPFPLTPEPNVGLREPVLTLERTLNI